MKPAESIKFLLGYGQSVLIGLALITLDTAALAVESVKSPANSSTFSTLFENDLFGDTDQQYTNGVQLSWESPDLTRYADAEGVPHWLLPIVANLPWINEPNTLRNVGFSVGQKMFTPNNTQSSSLVADDRPYAGWLYGALGFTSKTANRMDRFELLFGVIGPAAQGEETQNFVHDLRDIAKTRGWSHQLRNEPGLDLIYERKWRPFASTNARGFGYDLITHAGAETRFGWNLPGDFGTSYIRPGGNSNAPTTVDDPRMRDARAYGAYVFAAVTGRVVGRDIFLDGNTVADNHDVNKKNFVGDFIVGGSLVFYRYKLSYAQVFRSREFDGQRDKPNFGSISLSVTC
ncbi:MAG: lipid A deacylase LpxR family protein [Proteobacteria bacterium]|nr:lipid A deacylase LpxR family protein [Pseudomonadota bacterium]